VPDLLEHLSAALADRCAIESQAGHGGMAVVFRQRTSRHHRQVAIKVLHPQLTARYLREVVPYQEG
jgi:serine/threonine-protein kinase